MGNEPLRPQYKGRLLGQILWQKGILSESQLLDSLQEQKTKGGLLGAILVEKGIITENLLTNALAAQRGEADYTIEPDPN